MKNKIELDKNNRKRYIKNFFKKFGETLLKQTNLFEKKTNLLNSTGSRTRCRNLCIETGRGRGVVRFCQFSRILLRQSFGRGDLVGWRKSSW